MSNFTQTIEIPSSLVEYDHNEEGAYDKYVKPVLDKITNAVKEICGTQTIKPQDFALNFISNHYKYGKIKYEQLPEAIGHIAILWNKCRYFELTMTCPKDVQRFVKQSAKIKSPNYAPNMLVGNRFKLEAVVKAFNKKGYFCYITQDWV